MPIPIRSSALTFVPITLLATSGVPGQDAGLASGLFNTSRRLSRRPRERVPRTA
jgi:hypothetical protein